MNPSNRPQEIVHALPGRVRIGVRCLKNARMYARWMETHLLHQTGILSVDANIYTGTVLIHFDQRQVSVDQVIKQLRTMPMNAMPKNPILPEPKIQHLGLRPATTLLSICLLFGITSKKMLFGAGMLTQSLPLGVISGLITLFVGYPSLRQVVNRTYTKGSSTEAWVLGLVTTASLLLRESVIGFGVLSLIGVTTLWNHHKAEKHKQIIMHYGITTQRGFSAEHVLKISDRATADYFPEGVSQPLLPITLLLAGTGLLMAGFSRMLTILILGCPCAFSLARHLPNGLATGSSAQHGILIHRESIYHQLVSCSHVIFAPGRYKQQLGQMLSSNGYTVIATTETAELAAVIQRLTDTNMRFTLVGDAHTDADVFDTSTVRILLGADSTLMACADICIPSKDSGKLHTIWQFAASVKSCQSSSFWYVQLAQLLTMGFALSGKINLFAALNIHHGFSFFVLINSLLQTPQANPKIRSTTRTTRNNSSRKGTLRAPDQVKDYGCDLQHTDRDSGLTNQEAKHRLSLFGLNKLPDPEKISLLQRLSLQCKGTMALVMLGSTGVSLLAGGIWDSLALGSVLLINAMVGALQSDKADTAVGTMHQLTPRTSQVLREGQIKNISSEQIVPGDILHLDTGDRVPADGWLLSQNDIVIDESLLTGESEGVTKTATNLTMTQLSAGTTVIKGNVQLLVARTGMETRMGQIALMLREDNRGPTPLQLHLDNFGRHLLKALVLVCGAVFSIGVLRGQPLKQMALTSTSIAAATVPQGMTTFVTLGLVAGVRQLAKKKTVVRKLAALETMACVTCLCLDKTGTITQNQMAVHQIYTDQSYEVTGDGRSRDGQLKCNGITVSIAAHPQLSRLIHTAIICNDAQIRVVEGSKFAVTGDGTESALLVMAEKAGVDTNTFRQSVICREETAFSSERERMGVLAQIADDYLLAIKGSPEAVLRLCSLDETTRQELLVKAQELARQGLRVLAFAQREIPNYQQQSIADLEQGATFLGFVGMMDPPRANVKEVIARCKRAGIHVIMLTGDHPETAIAIGHQVGLQAAEETTITGRELALVHQEHLKEVLNRISIFSRVQPQQKRDIVIALKKAGFIVAMVGDGVNDGPALKAADVGISMGAKSTDVAQEASDMILATDDLAQIITAIEQGRTAYDNISKVISYLLTSNTGEISLLLSATASGMAMPLLPIQLLWVNLLGDGPPALALCLDRSDGHEFDRPPRKRDGTLLTESVKRKIVLRGLRMGLTTLGLYGLSIWQGVPLNTARTRTLAALGVEQILHLFESRFLEPSLPVPKNPTMSKTVFLSGGLLLASIYFPPIQRLFHLVPLQLIEWLLVLGFAVVAAPPRIPLPKHSTPALSSN